MLDKNNRMMEGLIQQSLEFIYDTYDKYLKRVDIAAVAFSGGKDSLVLLDLVQRALAPDEFVVVFGDTTMEIKATYEAVEKAQKHWSHLKFYTARSRKDARTTWKEMGPPSRIHRWCCTVHKSVPTLLLLRQLVNKPVVRALIFDGVRHEESATRAGYLAITDGRKHRMQTNASPIIDWNSGEVFLYLLNRQLLLNQAYRYGVMRVGCSICPMASNWWDMISGHIYKDDMQIFVDYILQYSLNAGVNPDQIEQYFEDGSWKGRAGGRFLAAGGKRVIEQFDEDSIKFVLRNPQEDWQVWARALGTIVRTGQNRGYIETTAGTYPYRIREFISNKIIELYKTKHADHQIICKFRWVATKAAYCTHCQACEVECPTGALCIQDKVSIDDERCTSCGSCLYLHEKACLTAKSLNTYEGGMTMIDSNKKIRALHTYQHFGMRREWLAEFFKEPDKWEVTQSLGSRQFEAMNMWLKHAEILNNETKNSISLTTFGKELIQMGVEKPLTWAMVWINLARNSTPVQWYITTLPWGTSFSKKELVDKVVELYPKSESTRNNAMTALVGLLTKTPLGQELGLGEETSPGKRTGGIMYKRGWLEPHPVAVLYSLYRYAELVGRYELTVKELYEQAPEGPYTLFGIEADKLKGLLQGWSSRNTDWIRADIVRDLDNIFLDSSRKAYEVLGLE